VFYRPLAARQTAEQAVARDGGVVLVDRRREVVPLVIARDDRRHHFSTTVDEHNAAVARYRLSRRLSRR